MDWNYPGFTACLVSALVLSVVLLFGDCLEWCPFRGFHRSPPLLWQQHTLLCLHQPGAAPWGTWPSTGSESSDLPDSRVPSGFVGPQNNQHLLPGVWGTWDLESHSWGQACPESREQVTESLHGTFTTWATLLYTPWSSDRGFLVEKAVLAPGKLRDAAASPWHKLCCFQRGRRTQGHHVNLLPHLIDFRSGKKISELHP